MKDNKKHILFLGGCFAKTILPRILQDSKHGVSDAADNLQWSFIDGLDHYFKYLNIISAPNIGAWPLKYKKIFFCGGEFHHRTGTSDYTVSFLNVALFHLLFRYISLKRALLKWAEKLPGDTEKIIVIYELTSNRLLAARFLKKHLPNVRIIQIVPDLPQFMSESRNPGYRILKWVDFKIMSRALRDVDGMVLLSEKMRDRLPIADKKFCVIEGIFLPPAQEISAAKEPACTILYTGNLTRRSGIRMLLEAFSAIKDKSFQLWIRGEGILMPEIIAAAAQDSRIRCIPRVSRSEILAMQKRASILVNPVSPSEDFADYFFPSKTMEYLASGTPVVMFQLGCIPKDYYPYIDFPEDVTAQSLARKFLEIAKRDPGSLASRETAAIRFINEEKNAVTQVAKLCNLIFSQNAKGQDT